MPAQLLYGKVMYGAVYLNLHSNTNDLGRAFAPAMFFCILFLPRWRMDNHTFCVALAAFLPNTVLDNMVHACGDGWL